MKNVEQEYKETKKKIPGKLKDNLQKIIIAIVSILYIAQGTGEVVKKGAGIVEIIGSIGVSVVIGIIIYENMRSMGLADGRRSEVFQNSVKAYGDAKVKATPNFDKLSAWCEYKNSWELELKRKEIIQSVGLKWKAYKIGFYEEHNEKLTDEQKKAIQKAKDCKVYRLTSQELLSDLPKYKTKNTNRFGKSQKEYSTEGAILDTFWKIIMGVVSGMFGLSPLINSDNAAEIVMGIIWNFMQIALWIALGLTKYSDARSFIEDEYRQTHLIQKTELLNEFCITMEKNNGIVEEYDDEAEIEQYIKEFIDSKKEKSNNGEKDILG